MLYVIFCIYGCNDQHQGLVASIVKERIDLKPYYMSTLTKVYATCKMMTENALEA